MLAPKQSSAAKISLAKRWSDLLAAPVDGSSLAIFRMIFGAVMLWQSYRFLWPAPNGGRLQAMYAPHLFHFPYPGLEWVTPLSVVGMQLVFLALGVAAVGMIVGYWYRASAIVLFLTWNYFFFSDQAFYQNHYYLISLFTAILIFAPAANCWSLDQWLRRRQGGKIDPLAAAEAVPFWSILLLRAQLFFMYFFASIAKFDVDWLTGIPIQGGCYGLIDNLSRCGIALPIDGAQLAYLLAWAGLFFDMAIGPMLILRRTRPLAIGLVFAFHGMNELMFSLAALPYLAAGTTLLFCEPDWPRRLWDRIQTRSCPAPDWKLFFVGMLAIPGIGALLGWQSSAASSPSVKPQPVSRWAAAAIALVLLLGVVVPLRHLVIEGDPDFTEEGYRFSWRMMQRTQGTFHVQFRVSPRSLSQTEVNGSSKIDWSKWSGERPSVVFVSSDANAMPWSKLPGLVLIYEPYLGIRAIGNPLSTDDATATRQLTERWKQATGRDVQARRTQSLAEALERAEVELTAAAEAEASQAWALQLERLALARKNAALQNPTTLQLVELIETCRALIAGRGGDRIRYQLAATHPFAIQGNQTADPFVVLDDPELVPADVWKGTVRLTKVGEPTPVLFDQSRQRTASWRDLPRIMLCEDARGIFVNWNHHHELTDSQIRRMAANPGMIHVYVQHVAREWQREQGVRPRVFVDSMVSHNRRPLQPMVRPDVDLASVRLTSLGHNEWIAPLAEATDFRAPATADSSPVIAPGTATEQVVARYPGGEKKITRLNLGDGRSRVRRWSESGGLTLVAEYLHDELDGKQTKYRPDGSREAELTYAAGKLHGIVREWHPTGPLAAEGTFENGRPVGSWTTWDTAGNLATPPRDGASQLR